MKKLFLFFVWIISFTSVYGQQDPLLATYQFNQLPFNPAYTGVHDITSFDLHYRNQWGDLDGAPASIFFTGQTSLVDNRVGVGTSLLYDKIGVTKNTNFNVSVSYELDLFDDVTLSFGLQSGLMAFAYDYDQLNLDDPTDPDFALAVPNFTKFNLGAGFFIRGKNFYGGFSVPQLLKVTEEINGVTGDRYNRHLYLSAGFIFDQLPGISLKPYTLLRISEGAAPSLDLGASVLLGEIIWAGLFTRNFNTVGLSANLNLVNGLRFGYAGELPLNSDQPSTGFNTHEINIGIDLEWFNNLTVARRYY
jgi:type IX secretion system PorP/SprF family membrane protein